MMSNIPITFFNDKLSININGKSLELVCINPLQFRQTKYHSSEMIVDHTTHQVVGHILITDHCITELNIHQDYINNFDEISRLLLDRAIDIYHAHSIKIRDLDQRLSNLLINYGFELSDEYVVHELKLNHDIASNIDIRKEI